MKKTLERLVIPATLVGLLGFHVAGTYLMQRVSEDQGGKIMNCDPRTNTPRVQPWITVYDEDGDGIADRTQVKYLGAFRVPVAYSREPSELEIEWYKSQD